MNKLSINKFYKILLFLLFLGIFIFLPSSQDVQANLCNEWYHAQFIDTNLSVSYPNINVKGSITNGWCVQSCGAPFSKQAVGDPISTFSYKFDNANWIPITKGGDWYVFRRASPTLCTDMGMFWGQYLSFIYKFDVTRSIASLTPGTHYIHLKYEYEAGKVNEGMLAFIVPTLSVTLTASPNSGTAPLNDVDLKADVDGTATGNIVYKFDCTSDGTWEHTSAATTTDPYTIADLCDYTPVGTHTAKVQATRGGLTATATITVSNPGVCTPNSKWCVGNILWTCSGNCYSKSSVDFGISYWTNKYQYLLV